METAGGIALLVGATRWGEAAIIRRHRWPHIDGQSKSEVHHDGGASALVPASALVADDDVRLQSGDEIPADGRLCSEQATVDEVAVMGRSRPAEKREGAPVFAGTRAMSPLRLRVAAPWQDSWAAQRDRRHDELMAIHVESDRPGRAAASALTLLAVSMAGLAMTRAGPMAIDLWLPTVAAMLMATIAVGPSFGRMRGRIALLHSLHRAGALLSRARDLRVLASARQWYLDPRLLATTGPVDVVALNEASPEELMVVAEALLRGRGGATHESLWAAIARKGLRPSPGASLEWTDDLLSGSLDGQRWFFGRVGQVQEKLGFALSDAQAGLIRGFEDRALTPWLIGREGEGLFGAIGVAVQADPAVARAAVELQARVIASIPEASMLAEQAVLPCGEDPGPRDATLMYERTEAPRAGMRVRVLEPRAALRLPRAGAPRIMRPAVERFGGALVAARTYRGAARRNAWLVTGAGMLTAAAVGLLAAASTLRGGGDRSRRAPGDHRPAPCRPDARQHFGDPTDLRRGRRSTATAGAVDLGSISGI